MKKLFKKGVYCDFCGKHEDEVIKVITKDDKVHICNECVYLCLEIVNECLDND